MEQEELQKLLDSLAEGPLGQKKEWQIERSFIANDLNKRRTKADWKDIIQKRNKNTDHSIRVANTDWVKKVKNTDYQAIVAKIDYEKRHIEHAEAYRKGNLKKRKPIKAFKITLVGNKRGAPIDTKTYVGTFETAYIAAEKLNLYQADIANVLRPKSKVRTTKGYTFEYV